MTPSPQNRTITSATVTTFAAMLAAYVTRATLTPNRPKISRSIARSKPVDRNEAAETFC